MYCLTVMGMVNLQLRTPGLLLAALAVLVSAGCVQLDFVRDYPLEGYPTYSTGSYPASGYYSGIYANGYYGGAYANGYYPYGIYPNRPYTGAYDPGYGADGYYSFSRGFGYPGDRYLNYPGYSSYYGYPGYHRQPHHRGAIGVPLAPPSVDTPDAAPKAPRGRNAGPVKPWRDVERSAASRGSTAVRTPTVRNAPVVRSPAGAPEVRSPAAARTPPASAAPSGVVVAPSRPAAAMGQPRDGRGPMLGRPLVNER